MNIPDSAEYAPYYAHYINLVKETNGLDALEQSGNDFSKLLSTIPEEKALYRYAPSKWSVNELIQHVIDAEIIFTYRALRIARMDKTPLPGFEENLYAPNSYADNKSLKDLSALFIQTRQLTTALFNSFEPKCYMNIGTASNANFSVRALCFIIAGHSIHHAAILHQRYL